METVENQRKEKVQQSADIDVVAISEIDKCAVVGECKFKNEKMDIVNTNRDSTNMLWNIKNTSSKRNGIYRCRKSNNNICCRIHIYCNSFNIFKQDKYLII